MSEQIDVTQELAKLQQRVEHLEKKSGKSRVQAKSLCVIMGKPYDQF